MSFNLKKAELLLRIVCLVLALGCLFLASVDHQQPLFACASVAHQQPLFACASVAHQQPRYFILR
jgi:hypothetical protein